MTATEPRARRSFWFYVVGALAMVLLGAVVGILGSPSDDGRQYVPPTTQQVQVWPSK